MNDTDRRCYTCKHLCSYGYHHWGCRLTNETVSADDYCSDYED